MATGPPSSSKSKAKLVSRGLTFLLISWQSLATPIPPLSVPELVKNADLILVGEVVAIRDLGAGRLTLESGEKTGRLMRGEVRADEVLKGPADLQTVEFRFFWADEPIGYSGVQLGWYRIILLKKVGSHYEFADPYHPSLVAARGAAETEPGDALERVTARIGRVLRSSEASSHQKREAIWALSTVKTESATLILRSALTQKDPAVRLGAAGALLERNDLSGIALAQDALLRGTANVSTEVLHNLRYAISEGVRSKEAAPVLGKLLRSQDVETRRAAASALWHSGTPASISFLVEALEDPDIEVRYYGVIGLAETMGQPDWRPNMDEFVSNQARYLNYWRAWGKERLKPQ
jgi:hypothetical protein